MNKIYAILTIIVLFSFLIRVYKIDSSPPSLTWDEAAVGYNAWTIANYGRDEYGNILPIYFRSFGEDKQPIHIYITAFFVKMFGLSEFSTRIPSALFGTLNVLLIFFLSRVLFNYKVGLLSSLFLAISPQNIHFSRFNHEANFALFFFMLGMFLFFHSIRAKKIFLPISLLMFMLSMLSYHAAEIAVPPILFLPGILYSRQISKNKQILIVLTLIIGSFLLLFIIQPKLFGVSRLNQTTLGKNDIEKTPAFKITQNSLLGRINLALVQYSWHFDPKFLFIQGDKNARLSSQTGEFHAIDLLLVILGICYLLYKRSKTSLIILTWFLIGPFPASVVGEAPHAARAMFMMGSWQIISAVGFSKLIDLVKKPILKVLVIMICLVILSISLSNYLKYYYGEFSKRYAIDWQYGMKQIIEYVKNHQEYNQVNTTAIRSQPYIFYLYYLKTPLPDYLNSVIFNNASDQSSNNVSSFGKYSFGGWSSIENPAFKGVLYVLSPSEYDGLLYRSNFEVNKIIYYPNGTTAFYIVNLK